MFYIPQKVPPGSRVVQNKYIDKFPHICTYDHVVCSHGMMALELKEDCRLRQKSVAIIPVQQQQMADLFQLQY